MNLAEIISRNRVRQALALEINRRAGEEVFPVMDHAQLAVWLEGHLGGARSIDEIKDLGAIALPEIDQGIVDLVKSESPDWIIVLGRRLEVEYSDGMPSVMFASQVGTHSWRDLPDDGVKLPGGRLVEVRVSIGDYDVEEHDIPKLKKQCAGIANRIVWDRWVVRTWEHPTISLPDPADPGSVVPEIVEYKYGTSVVDGSDLVAFGAVCLWSGYRYSASDPWFEGKWFQDRSKAEQARSASVVKLESIRGEAQRETNLEKAKAAAASAKSKLFDLKFRDGFAGLDHSLRLQVEDRQHSYVPYSLESLQLWNKETQDLIAKVESALKAKADAKAKAMKFTDEGKRWFKCGTCFRTLRVEASTYQRYNAGEEITLACMGCRGQAKVKMATQPSK